MHIPDGFVSPKVYIPAYAVAAGLWVYAARRVKRDLSEEALPLIAVITALAFVLMMIAIPLPGGTSVHASGIGVLAVLFGGWVSFLSISMVLMIQALLFGIGGVTSLPVNALAMGLAGGFVASWGFRLIEHLSVKTALFLAGWLAVFVPAIILAVVLGIQPSIAHTAEGTPLFFPFGIKITLPAITIPHALLGIGEGVLTVLVYQFVTRLRRPSL